MVEDFVSVEQLRDRIKKLLEEQMKAIQDAIYLGMTPDIANECEARRKLISKLTDAMAGLCKS